MAQVVKLEKSATSKLEQAKLLLAIYCACIGVHLSKSEEEVMALFMVYGINKKTKEMIVEMGVLKAQNSVANAMTELSKKKLLIKSSEKDAENNSFTVVGPMAVKFESMLGVMIKIERV